MNIIKNNENGFATILALIIVSLLFGLTLKFQGATATQAAYITYSSAAYKARQYAKAGVGYAAGKLAEDFENDPAAWGANNYVDALSEAWNTLTKDVSTGSPLNPAVTYDPYSVDGEGFFVVNIVDLSGRLKTNINTAKASNMIDAASLVVTGANVTGAVQLGMTEIWEVADVGAGNVFCFTPFGVDEKVNINTVDAFDTGIYITGVSARYVMTAVIKLGGTTSSVKQKVRRFLKYRRQDPNYSLALSTSEALSRNTPYDYGREDYFIPPPAAPPTPAPTDRVYMTADLEAEVGSHMSSVAYSSFNTYARKDSEGYFYIRSVGFIPDDPANPTGSRFAEYQVVAVVKRSTAPRPGPGTPLSTPYWRETWRDDNTTGQTKPIHFGNDDEHDFNNRIVP